MTDSAIGGVPTSGTHVAGDSAHDDRAHHDREGAPDQPVSLPEELIGTVEGVPHDATADAPDDDHGPDEVARLSTELAERTESLQRVSAEYANYRRRIDRERESTVAGAKAQVAGELLTVLDDIARAEAHGDLTGPFKVVADRLSETLARAGLVPFGAVGDAFDPSVHEAVAQETSAEVSGPTVSTVMRRGYRFGDKVLRPAMVAVTDRDPDATGDGAESPSD